MSRRRHIPAQKHEVEPQISEELLLAYLEDRLGPEERRKVEEALSHEGMESDAIEGLMAFEPDQLHQMQHGLNTRLHGLLGKRRRRRRSFPGQRWVWLAIVLILLFAVLGFLVIYLTQKH